MLCRVALVRTDISEELSASFIRVTGIGELETTLAVPSSPILVTLMKEGLSSSLLQEPHGVTSQKTPFFTCVLVKNYGVPMFTHFRPCIKLHK
jgi:hypothetical protein